MDTVPIPAQDVALELLLVAVAVALVTRRIGRPYTIALVLWGLLLGVVGVIDPIGLSKELVLAVFLPRPSRLRPPGSRAAERWLVGADRLVPGDRSLPPQLDPVPPRRVRAAPRSARARVAGRAPPHRGNPRDPRGQGRGLGLIADLRHRDLPRAWRPVIVWAGLRGAVPVALAWGCRPTCHTGPSSWRSCSGSSSSRCSASGSPCRSCSGGQG